jgi:hypothetical protein
VRYLLDNPARDVVRYSEATMHVRKQRCYAPPVQGVSDLFLEKGRTPVNVRVTTAAVRRRMIPACNRRDGVCAGVAVLLKSRRPD